MCTWKLETTAVAPHIKKSVVEVNTKKHESDSEQHLASVVRYYN